MDESGPHLIRVTARGDDLVMEQDGNEIVFPMERGPAVASLILKFLDHWGKVETCR